MILVGDAHPRPNRCIGRTGQTICLGPSCFGAASAQVVRVRVEQGDDQPVDLENGCDRRGMDWDISCLKSKKDWWCSVRVKNFDSRRNGTCFACILELESPICVPTWLLAFGFWLWLHLASLGFTWLMAFGFWFWFHLALVLVVHFTWLLAFVGFQYWSLSIPFHVIHCIYISCKLHKNYRHRV